MSQGDLYRLADSERRGIEVSRDGGYVMWAELIDCGPDRPKQFLRAVQINKDRLIPMPLRYHAGHIRQKEEA